MVILWAFIVMLMTFVAAEAEIYRYVDENGVIYYTDVPMNKKAEKIVQSQAVTGHSKNNTIRLNEKKDYHAIVKEKADKYEIDPSLVHAVIKAESNGNPYAVSRKGAKGLMQLMPSTAIDLQVRNVFDPEENIDGGTRYLRYLIDKFNGDLTLALAAYNAGPKTVEKSWTVPQISETKQYIRKVLSLYDGKNYSASSRSHTVDKSQPIYKVITEDGTVLFTNIPFNKTYPRF